jgi:hypothetical protein
MYGEAENDRTQAVNNENREAHRQFHAQNDVQVV